MGGYGSGRPTLRRRKKIVENCFTISADDLPAISNFHDEIQLPIKRAPGRIMGTLCCQFVLLDNGLQALQAVCKQTSTPTNLVLPLGYTAARSGGSRLCFRCPLSAETSFCGNNCRKLYAPPNATIFGCRQCHDLIYASSQCRAKRIANSIHAIDDLMTQADGIKAKEEAGKSVSLESMLKTSRRLSHAVDDVIELLSESEYG